MFFEIPTLDLHPGVFAFEEAMDPHDRNISLVMDEKSLKQHLDYDRNSNLVHGVKNGKPLNQALVFMVRGLATKWKQPIAYFHNNSTVSTYDLSALLREAVTKIEEAGLHVRCIRVLLIWQHCVAWIFPRVTVSSKFSTISLVKLFVVTRIFYFIKFYNRDLSPRNKANVKKMARVLHK